MRISEIRAREIREKFVSKHSETIACIKNYPTVPDIYKFRGQITREFIGLRMRTFQGIVFKRTGRYRKIFKSVLV